MILKVDQALGKALSPKSVRIGGSVSAINPYKAVFGIAIARSPLEENTKLEMQLIAEHRYRKGLEFDLTSNPEIQNVGFGDIGQDANPNLAPGEFVARTQENEEADSEITEISEGIKKFLAAIQLLNNEPHQLGFTITEPQKLPFNTPSVILRGYRRNFVVAKNDHVWILELEANLQNQMNSIIVASHPESIDELLDYLFYDGLNSLGWWSHKNILRSFEEMNMLIKFVHHHNPDFEKEKDTKKATENSIKIQSQRILRAIKDVFIE
jgi:hypothetical protein